MENLQYEEIYSDTSINKLKNEFSRLKDVAYLDHTGATLYSETQARCIAEDLCSNVYGNPHALNSSSKFSSDVVEQVRERVLSHFKTDSRKYDVIFTSGATAALKLVAETFDWGSDGNFVYLAESHTSVLGMRELAAKNKANIQSLSNNVVNSFNNKKKINIKASKGNCLFAYPAQCNFSGVKYPLAWISEVQQGLLGDSRWAVMLDAASFVATSQLDLSQFNPDFVCLSFYKMFGLPTGLGALLVLRTSQGLLSKTYFGGGTVLMARSCERKHVPRTELHERFEDGTISFLSIAGLRHGFDTLARLVPGGMSAVETHSFRLARHLHHSLVRLKHASGQPLAVLYCDTDFKDQAMQGPVVNFNLLRDDGSYIGFSEVLHMCNLFGVHVRTGCFCNPGACQRHLNLSLQQLEEHFEAGHVCGDSIDIVAGQPTGSVRASLGYSSTIDDVHKLLSVITKCFLETSSQKMPLTLTNLANKTEESPRLSRIFLYPVKSCGAQDVASWPLDARGLVGDRAWMIATDAGVALTQKHEPRICLVRPKLDLHRGKLTLSFPDMQDIEVPYLSASPSGHSKVCGAKVQTWDCGDGIADWLSEALGRSGLRLLRQWTNDERTQKKSSTGLSLANQAQFLLIGVGSLAWLEQEVVTRARELEEHEVRCEGEELLLRFRSNLVITGVKQFEETKWKAIKIGSVLFKGEGPCTRCQMVCISQNSGEKTTEPLRTLTAACQGRMQFGAYFSHAGPVGLKLYAGSPVSPVLLQD